MRKKKLIGNWKMNTLLREGIDLFEGIQRLFPGGEAEIGIACPSTHIYALVERSNQSSSPIMVGAQDCSSKESGAFTGEISAKMIQSAGGQFTLIGHSERRKYHGEGGDLMMEKIKQALDNDLHVIYCLGESLEERKAGRLFDVLRNQLEEGPYQFAGDEWSNITLAYEPVWAIGTGETASPEQAQKVHAFLRNSIREKFDDQIAESLTILYGGSCKPSNSTSLFAQADIDGGLIGGASLKAEDFTTIYSSFPTK